MSDQEVPRSESVLSPGNVGIAVGLLLQIGLERVVYYGLRSQLFSYLIDAPENGGLGLSIPVAGDAYDRFSSTAMLAPLIGGVAAWLLRGRAVVLIGWLLLAAGCFATALFGEVWLIPALTIVAVGHGCSVIGVYAVAGRLFGLDRHRLVLFWALYSLLSLGALTGPSIASGSMQVFGHTAVFVAVGACSAVGAAIAGAMFLPSLDEGRFTDFRFQAGGRASFVIVVIAVSWAWFAFSSVSTWRRDASVAVGRMQLGPAFYIAGVVVPLVLAGLLAATSRPRVTELRSMAVALVALSIWLALPFPWLANTEGAADLTYVTGVPLGSVSETLLFAAVAYSSAILPGRFAAVLVSIAVLAVYALDTVVGPVSMSRQLLGVLIGVSLLLAVILWVRGAPRGRPV